jgi:hypothetical protein
MADNRRIITGTHIVPKEGNTMEEAVGTKWILDTSVGKTLGGKSIVTDINANQWHDDWTSMDHPSLTPATTITLSPSSQSVYQLDDDTSTVKFFYMKNLGVSDSITISLDSGGDWVDFDTTAGSDEEWQLITGNWESYGATDASDEEWQLIDVNWQSASSNWQTYSDDTSTDFWQNFSDDTTTDFWENTSRLWEGPGFAKSAIIPAGGALYMRSSGTGGTSFTIDKVHIWLGEYPTNGTSAVDIEYVIAK